jgi:hypothetical protein
MMIGDFLFGGQVSQFHHLSSISPMNRTLNILIASIGIFAGSLISDAMIGDVIQLDDFQQAAIMGLLAAMLQWWINRGRD